MNSKITLNTVRATIRQCGGIAPATRLFLTSPACDWDVVKGTEFNTEIPADDEDGAVHVRVERIGASESALIAFRSEDGATAGVHATIFQV